MFKLSVILFCCLSANARVAIVDSNVAIEDVDNSLQYIDTDKHATVNSTAEYTVVVADTTSETTIGKDNLVATTTTTESIRKDVIEMIKTSNDSKFIIINENNKITLVPQSVLTKIQETENEIKIKVDLPTYNKSSPFFDENSTNVAAKPDLGEALILTPLIIKGNLKQARSASKVNPDIIFGIESYSGFFTVNEEYDSNLFFWYFPVPGKPVNDTPWLVWLQGGPGASCLTGLFDEIGPVTVDEDLKLKLREHSWGKDHSLLFIENPVGTGFSFTNSPLGYAHHVNTSSSDLYAALQQFLQVFPELRQAPLFIAGESYAGKYIPGLAMEIHNHKDTEDADINLQGLAIGNGFIEPSSMVNYSRVMYHFGLIDQPGRDLIEEMERSYVKLIEKNDNVAAKEQWKSTVIALCILTSQKHLYNFLKNDLEIARYESFLKRLDVRKAIHVGSIDYSFVNMTVNTEMRDDFLSNSRPLMEMLLEHYRVLLYSGQLDQMIPYVLSAENYRTWRWSGSEQFNSAKRHPWLSGGKVSGYHKSGGNLTEMLVRGAGHTVPTDQPAAAKDLITRFVRNQPWLGYQDIHSYLALMKTKSKADSDQIVII